MPGRTFHDEAISAEDGPDFGTSQPLILRAQAFEACDAGFGPRNGPAYPFLKQDEQNSQKHEYSHQNRKYCHDAKKFL